MKIKFWGVRGSIPCPGLHTVKYGGNTACVELRFKDLDRIIIIDAGSGIRELGNYMLAHDLSKGPIKTEIFLTHTHWDHIMGFPFFSPIYIPGIKLKIYGPVNYEDETLEDILGGQLTYRYFPVRQAELVSEIKYIELKEDSFDFGNGIRLTTKYLNHPVLSLGYRFEHCGKIFCTVYDTEPFHNVFCTDIKNPSYDESIALEGEQVAKEENRRVEDFFADADLVIHDTQYTQKEYESSKMGWGHSSFEHAISAALRAKVKRLALFHHDPLRTDSQIDELSEKYCRKKYPNNLEVFFAREGMQIDL
ncbi:MAG: MBL fold metallo-hydrolase [Desulfobacterales bacterium]|nr:MBL fold metallo-hydrolase [Desulfobacterales bacterium]